MTSESPFAQYLPCLIIHEITRNEPLYNTILVLKKKKNISRHTRGVTDRGHVNFSKIIRPRLTFDHCLTT